MGKTQPSVDRLNVKKPAAPLLPSPSQVTHAGASSHVVVMNSDLSQSLQTIAVPAVKNVSPNACPTSTFPLHREGDILHVDFPVDGAVQCT
ncbi:hypothetical protein CEXT_103071 [Caerostris extrusa]|uniref:Uncharacterized protein n=1 Tax=Caerostris extrusa TaxID=172846 RepID=A0AAV4X2U0_CAEEX|nr:hypothetical protein CEXT_103071 [Caerostris extrusa]